MKELEALELIDSYITLDDYDRETSGVAEALRLLKKTLTEPTAEQLITLIRKFYQGVKE